jgi:hypothetical protein
VDELEHQRQRAKLLQAYRDVFSGESGELVLRDLMREAGFISPSFAEPTHLNDGMAVALRAAQKEGRRALVLHILARREAPVDEVFQQMEEMIRHAQDRRSRDDGESTLEWPVHE